MTHIRSAISIGSLAKGSINRILAKALVRLAPPELEFRDSFKDLPLYSYDYDANYPRPAKRSRPPSRPSTPCCSSPRNTIVRYPVR